MIAHQTKTAAKAKRVTAPNKILNKRGYRASDLSKNDLVAYKNTDATMPPHPASRQR